MAQPGTTRKRKRSRRDPSEGGWDTTILVADDSHKARHHHHKHGRHRRKWPKVLAIVAAVIVVLVGAGAASAALYLNKVNNSMSLGEYTEEIKQALTEIPVSQPFYVLVLGSDMRQSIAAEEMEAAGKDIHDDSDLIMLLRVDAPKSLVTMLSVQRDTPAISDDGTIQKLKYVYGKEGPTGSIKAVEKIAGVDITHYVEVHGTDLEELVDNLGGISVDVPMAFDYKTITGNQVHLEKGPQRLNGAEALAFANMRVLYEGDGGKQDMQRQSAARQVVTGIINAVRERPLAQIPDAVVNAAACVKTDFSTSDLIDLARIMGSSVTVYSGTSPNTGALNPYVYDERVLEEPHHPWLDYVNDAGWARVIATMNAGEDPSTVSYKDDVVHFAGQPEETWDQGPLKPEEAEKYLKKQGLSSDAGSSDESEETATV